MYFGHHLKILTQVNAVFFSNVINKCHSAGVQVADF